MRAQASLLGLCNYICFFVPALSSTWSEWWTYEGISGPEFWGLVNPDWYMCSRGKHQSPIDIDPTQLIFDPNLKPLRIDRHKQVKGSLINTGRDLKIIFDEDPNTSPYINITRGPLAYHYKAMEVSMHFGANDQDWGSEHAVNGVHFPGEFQIIGYNAELYGNMSQATTSTSGLVGISILVQIGKSPNPELESITGLVNRVTYKGQQAEVQLSINGLVPLTNDYITYEGSLTQPGCQETVTWVVLNKPLYVGKEQMDALRRVMQGDKENPKFPMYKNCRPTMSVQHRPIRTNIQLRSDNEECNVERLVYYKANILERS